MSFLNESEFTDIAKEAAGNTAGFLVTRNTRYGRGLSSNVGGMYGAGLGFLIGGPIGAAGGAAVGGNIGGLLYDVGLGIRSLITGETFS